MLAVFSFSLPPLIIFVYLFFLVSLTTCFFFSSWLAMVWKRLKEELVTNFLVHKIATTIMKYVDESIFFSSDEDITEDSIFQTIKTITNQRYLHVREPINKTLEQLVICLTNWKIKHPDLFCIKARMYLCEFNMLVDSLKDEAVFSNNSATGNNPS